jgi:hypothetical protein
MTNASAIARTAVKDELFGSALAIATVIDVAWLKRAPRGIPALDLRPRDTAVRRHLETAREMHGHTGLACFGAGAIRGAWSMRLAKSGLCESPARARFQRGRERASFRPRVRILRGLPRSKATSVSRATFRLTLRSPRRKSKPSFVSLATTLSSCSPFIGSTRL